MYKNLLIFVTLRSLLRVSSILSTPQASLTSTLTKTTVWRAISCSSLTHLSQLSGGFPVPCKYWRDRSWTKMRIISSIPPCKDMPTSRRVARIGTSGFTKLKHYFKHTASRLHVRHTICPWKPLPIQPSFRKIICEWILPESTMCRKEIAMLENAKNQLGCTPLQSDP